MAKAKTISDKDQVTAYIKELKPAFAKIIEALRQLILKSDKLVAEQIKWNSPAFYYTGEMKPFDPKEYKRDILVMNLRNERILLIFPTGDKIKDKTGLLEGDYKDGRRMINLADMQAVKDNEKNIQSIIREWIKLVDK